MAQQLRTAAQVRAEIEGIIAAKLTSPWLREALRGALNKDCVDAKMQAQYAAKLLTELSDALTGQGE